MGLKVLIKMADVILTFKIMPESPDVDLVALEALIKEKILAFAGEGEIRVEVVPIAFGLNALNVVFVADEAQGGTESLEAEITELNGVNSVEVTDVRRAIG